MRGRSLVRALAGVLALAASLPQAQAAIITQTEVYTPYQYNEFYAVADGQDFRVVIRGNPFAQGQEAFEREVLDALRNGIVGPRVNFTTTPNNADRRPDYRLVMMFGPARSVSGDTLCRRLDQAPPNPARTSEVVMAIAYCRNEQVLTEAWARTDAVSASDGAFRRMFAELMPILFPLRNPNIDSDRGRFRMR